MNTETYNSASEIYDSINTAQEEAVSIEDAMENLTGRMTDLRSGIENLYFAQDELLTEIDENDAADRLSEIVHCIFDVRRGIASWDDLVRLAEVAPVNTEN